MSRGLGLTLAPTPAVHWTSPCPPTEDDLRCSVMASGDNGAMVFMVKGGTAEVHHPHSRALDAALVSLLGAKQKRMGLCTTAAAPALLSAVLLSPKWQPEPPAGLAHTQQVL